MRFFPQNDSKRFTSFSKSFLSRSFVNNHEKRPAPAVVQNDRLVFIRRIDAIKISG